MLMKLNNDFKNQSDFMIKENTIRNNYICVNHK